MKNLIFTIALSIVSSVVMAYTVVTRVQVQPITEIDPSRPLALEVVTPKIEAPKIELILKNHNKFLEDLGMRESSGDYKAVNQYGYLGKYQFGGAALIDLGYKIKITDGHVKMIFVTKKIS